MPSYQQILAGTPVTITETFRVDSSPIDVDSGLPTLTLARPDGTAYTPIPTVLNSWTGRTTGQYRFVLPRQPNPYRLTYALEGIIGGEPITLRGEVEWIGANLFNLDDLRAMRVAGGYPFASNAVPLISNEQIQEIRAAALEEMTQILGYSPVPRFAREYLDGGGGPSVQLVDPGWEAHHPPLSVTVNGVAQSVAGYSLSSKGVLKTASGFSYGAGITAGLRNVVVEYVHGWDRPRGLASHVAMLWAAAQLNPSGFSSAQSVSLPDGSTYTYEPSETGRGGFQRFTGVRELDRWLNRWALAGAA